jgi:hypothetical protein
VRERWLSAWPANAPLRSRLRLGFRVRPLLCRAPSRQRTPSQRAAHASARFTSARGSRQRAAHAGAPQSSAPARRSPPHASARLTPAHPKPARGSRQRTPIQRARPPLASSRQRAAHASARVPITALPGSAVDSPAGLLVGCCNGRPRATGTHGSISADRRKPAGCRRSAAEAIGRAAPPRLPAPGKTGQSGGAAVAYGGKGSALPRRPA